MELTVKKKHYIHISFLILIIIAGISEGCKKYEDGPFLTFRTPKKRIIGGWLVEKFTIGSIDYAQELNDSIQPVFYFDELSEYVSYKYTINVLYYKNTIEGYRRGGRFSFEDNKNILEVEFEKIPKDSVLFCENFNYLGPLFYNNIVSFNILKLTNRKLHIKTNCNNQEYYFELIKK